MALRWPVLLALVVASSGCLVFSSEGTFERPYTRRFVVADDATVRIRVSGGSIRVTTGVAGAVEITLTARVPAATEADADRAVGDYAVEFEQKEGEILASARRKTGPTSFFGNRNVHFRADLTVPAGVALDLDTSGGSISVRGDRRGALRADTSGGSITVDGGAGELFLDTSGGSIRVGQALGTLSANTSGGSITVSEVGAQARAVDLETSGGSIRVGIDPASSLRVVAGTSGGSVSVDGLEWTNYSRNRNRLEGMINDGRGALRAQTSGGSIRISAATPER
jgi:hypothetical protein